AAKRQRPRPLHRLRPGNENSEHVPPHANRGGHVQCSRHSRDHHHPERPSPDDEGTHRERCHSGLVVPKDPTIAIRDCLSEIAVLQEIEARTTLQTFRSDPIIRRAAAYAIQTISEAVRRIPDDWLAEFPTEPWGQIKAIGNRIRHEYFRVDDAI